MPRDDQGNFEHAFTFAQDAAARIPYSPIRHDERFDDIKLALNDIPKIYPPGTDPNSVLPPSVMQMDGKLYICIENGDDSGDNVWREFGNPGLTDASGLATLEELSNTVSVLVGDAPSSLNTLGEISNAINDDPLYYQTVNQALTTKAGVVHTHTIADVEYLQSSLNNIANLTRLSSAISTSSFQNWYDAIPGVPGSKSYDLGSVTLGAVFFRDEELPPVRLSLAEGSSNIDLGVSV